MSTASKGRALEHEIRSLLRAGGFDVIRGAASKGEFAQVKADLVASRLTAQNEFKVYLTVIVAQCKVKRLQRRES